MIISRRKSHLYASIAMAIILPIIFVAGLVLRPTYATVTPDIDELASRPLSQATTQPQALSHQKLAAFLQQ